MKRFTTSLLLFISSLPLLTGKSTQAVPSDPEATARDDFEPVGLRPLNLPSDNLFAAHRSHASHRSHRSSSGGGGAIPRERAAPQPAPAQEPSREKRPKVPVPPDAQPLDRGSAQPTDPGRAAPVSPSPQPQTAPHLTLAEKKALQVMRVQIALNVLGLYNGSVSGDYDGETKKAVSHFQTLKGIEPSGLMTTETLNALGVPAVQ